MGPLASASRHFEGCVLLISCNRDLVDHDCVQEFVGVGSGVLARVESRESCPVACSSSRAPAAVQPKKLLPEETKTNIKRIRKRIRSGEELPEGEENFCIDHNL